MVGGQSRVVGGFQGWRESLKSHTANLPKPNSFNLGLADPPEPYFRCCANFGVRTLVERCLLIHAEPRGCLRHHHLHRKRLQHLSTHRNRISHRPGFHRPDAVSGST